MQRASPSVVWARLCRSRLRLWSAVIALTTAVRVWPGVVGWLVGGFAALGLIFFEFGRWKDYVLDGPETPTEPARLSGSARYRQPGTTRVVLVSVGAHPHLVAMRVRRVAGVDQADAIRIIDRAPTTVVEHISLPSAEKVVAALAAAGAVARLELEQNWSQTAPSTPDDRRLSAGGRWVNAPTQGAGEGHVSSSPDQDSVGDQSDVTTPSPIASCG